MSPNATRILVHVACALPILFLLYGLYTNQLGANPVETLTDESGIWALRLLLLSLTITPLRRLTRFNFMRYRRAIGLWAFFYATFHLTVFVLFDHGLDFQALWEDVVKRKFMTAGMVAYLLLIPLALTSNKKSIKKLGAKWVKLHRLVYLSLIAVNIHLIWLTKANDYSQIAPYILASIVLLVYRIQILRR